ERARALLGKLYAGRRIDALDRLALPPLIATEARDAGHRVNARLPPYYISVLGDPVAAKDALGLASASTSAFLPSVRSTAPASAVAARARIEMVKRYWRAVDVDEAVRAAQADAQTPEGRFYLALALALRGGPEDAARMMLTPPPEALGIGNVAALDAIAA